MSGFGGRGKDAFGAHAALGEEFAELLEEPGIFLEQTGDERFGDLAGFAIGLGGDGGATGFSGEEGHFAEVIACVNGGDNGFGGTDGDRDDGLAAEDDEHGVAWLSLFDNDFPDPEAEELGGVEEFIDLIFVEELDEGLFSDGGAGGEERLLMAGLWAIDLDRANGEGHDQTLAFGEVPNIGANAIMDLAKARFVFDRKL